MPSIPNWTAELRPRTSDPPPPFVIDRPRSSPSRDVPRSVRRVRSPIRILPPFESGRRIRYGVRPSRSAGRPSRRRVPSYANRTVPSYDPLPSRIVGRDRRSFVSASHARPRRTSGARSGAELPRRVVPLHFRARPPCSETFAPPISADPPRRSIPTGVDSPPTPQIRGWTAGRTRRSDTYPYRRRRPRARISILRFRRSAGPSPPGEISVFPPPL
mmetsp:Transcript_48257/g.145855  ORF Transcript_48257/g.145855 Transcript_48257/m.145855 type:complete len:216 (-) Transcript_48257:237-884(-)